MGPCRFTHANFSNSDYRYLWKNVHDPRLVFFISETKISLSVHSRRLKREQSLNCTRSYSLGCTFSPRSSVRKPGEMEAIWESAVKRHMFALRKKGEWAPGHVMSSWHVQLIQSKVRYFRSDPFQGKRIFLLCMVNFSRLHYNLACCTRRKRNNCERVRKIRSFSPPFLARPLPITHP